MELFDAPKNPEVTDINAVPADFRWMYKEQSGKHVLDAENPGVKSAISVVAGARNALAASRQEAKDAKGKIIDLSPLSDWGSTPSEIASKIAETKKGWEDQVKTVNVEKIKEGVQKEWQPKLEKEQLKSKALTDRLFNVLVVGEAAQALVAAKGDAELLMPFVRNQIKVVENAGEFDIHVVDPASGETRYGGNGRMSIKELVAEMKGNVKYGRLFESEAAVGTGHRPGSSAPKAQVGAATSRTREEMSPTQKIQSGLKKGQYVRPQAA